MNYARQEISFDDAATAVTSGLVPAKSTLVGVRVTVLSSPTSGDGADSVNIGDGTDADKYGAGIAVTKNTVADGDDVTANPQSYSANAQEVTLTAAAAGVVGGETFDGGKFLVEAYFQKVTY